MIKQVYFKLIWIKVYSDDILLNHIIKFGGYKMIKELLRESYQITKKISGIDPSRPGNTKPLLINDTAFSTYVTALSEGLSKKDVEGFTMLAENTRINLLENSMFQINPYESLSLPILRVFYPKLIAKEAVTLSPMDKPETVKAFLTATFTPSKSTTEYPAPVVARDISQGPSIGTPVAANIAVPSVNFDVLGAMSITKAEAHLERDFMIVGVSDGTTDVSVSIVPAVEGHFSQSVTVGGVTDVISGQVDYLNGTVSVSSATGTVTEINYQVTCSLEENKVNPRVKLSVDKVRLYAKDREISANWSINLEQDMRALFDLSMQAEIVNILGQQIALDIDREIVDSLITANTRLNAASHTKIFTRTPPPAYTWGTKYWHENIVVSLNELSAQIYTDTNMDQGNVILANPLDAAILEDLQTFQYSGTSSVDGDLGYRSATVAGGKWRVLTSAIVPKGSMVVLFKPAEELRSVYIYAPYVPAVLHPYPLGNTPSLTILSRYANALVRSNGIAVLNIGA
jgi:hypothetical protein